MRHDERNQLIGFEARRGGALLGKSSYRYDAFNRRVASFADTDGDGHDDVVTYQVYGGQAAWQLLAEYDGAGDAANLLRSYVYGLFIDEVLSMRDHASDDDYFYHQDDLFSVYALTDADGVVVERYDYGDYGQVSIMEANGTPRASSAYDNRHAFTGRLLMPELTLDDGSQILEYRHRYMLASNGRFVQRDPLGYVDGMNLFLYAKNSPLFYSDPMGLRCWVGPYGPVTDCSWEDQLLCTLDGLRSVAKCTGCLISLPICLADPTRVSCLTAYASCCGCLRDIMRSWDQGTQCPACPGAQTKPRPFPKWLKIGIEGACFFEGLLPW